jgi:precorrin-2 methylase
MTTSGNDRVQEGMRQTGERWLRVRRALKKEEQAYADRLAAMIRSHTDDQFATIGDPLEAAMLSVFIELLKMIRSEKRGLQTEMVDTAEGDAAAEGQNRG